MGSISIEMTIEAKMQHDVATSTSKQISGTNSPAGNMSDQSRNHNSEVRQDLKLWFSRDFLNGRRMLRLSTSNSLAGHWYTRHCRWSRRNRGGFLWSRQALWL